MTNFQIGDLVECYYSTRVEMGIITALDNTDDRIFAEARVFILSTGIEDDFWFSEIIKLT